MFTFSFEISTLSGALFGCAVTLFIIIVFIYLKPVARVSRAVKIQNDSQQKPGMSQPVSVIVFADDDSESLRRLLPAVLGQSYEAPFEVIVVNDGQSDTTTEIVERLRLIHNNLYMTYTPVGAKQLSRKKLALLIGIKAARYSVVVHTTSSAIIDSENWLARIAEPFADDAVEVVLGHSYLDHNADKKTLKRSRVFNSVADASVWLSSAIKGKPYRGTELNLAYTRDAFFRNKGFSGTLNLKYGDDDVFINEIATGRNTRVVLHPESFVRRSSERVAHTYGELRSRYCFTAAQLPHAGRRLNALGAYLMWAVVALCVAGALFMLPNLLGVAIGAVILVAMFLSAIVVWRKAVKTLTGRKMLLSLPALMLLRPLANIVAYVKSEKNKRYYYSWS